MMLSHRSPGFLSSSSVWREILECDNSGGLPLIVRFSRFLSIPRPVSLPKEEPSSSSTQDRSLSPCAIFPFFTDFPTTSSLNSFREGTRLAFPRGNYLTKKRIILQATLFLLHCSLRDHITLADSVHYIYTLGYFTKDCVFSIQMRCGQVGDEKLGTICIGAGISHRNHF